MGIDGDGKNIVIFPFISRHIVASKAWIEYMHMELVCHMGECHIIPVAVDDDAYRMSSDFNHVNFIRLSDLTGVDIERRFYISVAHEIYRFGLNEERSLKDAGKESSLKIFLSHAKKDKEAVAFAKGVKRFADTESNMKNFFDVNDIAPGFPIEAEIDEGIKGATFIAIISDHYAERYWCQKEVLKAKKSRIPMIAVDLLNESEDRAFPYLSNIPVVRVNNHDDQREVLRVLDAVMTETLRHHYAEHCLQSRDGQYSARPLEPCDIAYYAPEKAIACPAPMPYKDERDLLNKVFPAMQIEEKTILKGKRAGISISTPPETEMVAYGVGKMHLDRLAQALQLFLIRQEAVVVYGGDFRPGGFTEIMLEEAEILQDRYQEQEIYLESYVAWPIYKECADFEAWRAKCYHLANLIEVPPDDSSCYLIDKDDPIAQRNTIVNNYIKSKCLTAMREKMIASCDFRICAGGKSTCYHGIVPGVLEEVLIAVKQQKPVYLIGGFGGITGSICQFIMQGKTDIATDSPLSVQWQQEQDSSLEQLLDFYQAKKEQTYYDSLAGSLRFENLHNGLTKEENEKLFREHSLEEIERLVLKGVQNCLNCG